MKHSLLAMLIIVAAATAQEQGAKKVLFVGNSLTYFSDIPALVQAIGAGLPPPVIITPERVMASATSLSRHLSNGKVQGVIERGGWDAVVLQPYGDWKGESIALTTYRKLIPPSTRIILYITPHRVLEGPDQRTAKSLQDAEVGAAAAVSANDAWIAPCLHACLAAKTADPSLEIRHPARVPGNAHQGPIASYLNACVIFTVLTGRSPVGSAASRITADKYWPHETVLDDASRNWLQALALRTVAGYRPGIGTGFTSPTLSENLPDTTVPADPSLSLEQRQAARLAARWAVYERMLQPLAKDAVRTEFNRGILDAIIADFPGSPDAERAVQILKERGADPGYEDSDRKR